MGLGAVCQGGIHGDDVQSDYGDRISTAFQRKPAPEQCHRLELTYRHRIAIIRQKRIISREDFRTKTFDRSVRTLGATDEDLQALEAAIAADPDLGDVIKGLKGARKIRFAMASRGKRGGGQAIYVVVRVKDAAYLLLAYAKSAQAEISKDQRKAIKAVIEGLP